MTVSQDHTWLGTPERLPCRRSHRRLHLCQRGGSQPVNIRHRSHLRTFCTTMRSCRRTLGHSVLCGGRWWRPVCRSTAQGQFLGSPSAPNTLENYWCACGILPVNVHQLHFQSAQLWSFDLLRGFDVKQHFNTTLTRYETAV